MKRFERPAFAAGLALVVLHLLDLVFRGPATNALGVLGITAVAAGWFVLQPLLSRVTRAALALTSGAVLGLMCALSDGASFATSGPQWDELSGVGGAIGGALLVSSGIAALAAPPRKPERPRRRSVRITAWVAGAIAFTQIVLFPVGVGVWTVHAPRLPISDSALGIPHENVRIAMPGGKLAGWYVPSRNGAAVLMIHGSSGNRTRVADHARLLARHGYGVLAIDLPGNGESDGRSNGLGAGAQPAVAAALRYLAARPDVEDGRVGGLGLSLGAELLLEAAASNAQLRAVVADGAERDSDDARLGHVGGPALEAQHWLTLQVVRAVSGTRPPAPLVDSVARIGARPVLLIASSARSEIAVNRVYREKIGASAQLWELPDTGHTRGLDTHPREYEKRVVAFYDDALL